MAQNVGEEQVATLAAENNKGGTSSAQGNSQAVETTESSKSGLTAEKIYAMGLEARKNAWKAVENLSPEERKADSQLGVSPYRAMLILEELEDFDCSDGEEEREPAEAEAAKSSTRTTEKGGQDEHEKPARDA